MVVVVVERERRAREWRGVEARVDGEQGPAQSSRLCVAKGQWELEGEGWVRMRRELARN